MATMAARDRQTNQLARRRRCSAYQAESRCHTAKPQRHSDPPPTSSRSL